jgi:uncharacterized protein YjbJ (UPF0337 family)
MTHRFLNGSFLRIRIRKQPGGDDMNRDELDGKAKQVKGKVKQGLGDLADDERLREEGLEDEAEGEVQETFGTARRKVGEAVKDLGEKIKR